MTADLGFTHLFRPPAAPGAPILLLLHGTGGNEHSLLPVAEALQPEAAVLSPRGQVLERGMPRFFRRLAEGVFDLDDLQRRTRDLAAFIDDATAHYRVDRQQVVAVGFSNGANIAASLLLLAPSALAGAVLFRAMVPLVPDPLPAIPGTPVFLSNGRTDPLVPLEETERLSSLLTGAGAEVTVTLQPVGHELTTQDITQARDWLIDRRHKSQDRRAGLYGPPGAA